MMNHRGQMGGSRAELVGDFDDYGMPTIPGSPAPNRGSGLMNRLRKHNKQHHAAAADDDDDDDDGFEGGPSGFPEVNLREVAGLRDRHRYPTLEDGNQSRTYSMTSNMSSFDTTPIIPMLGPQGKTGKNQAQYRQRVAEQRRQLLSSDTGLPMPGGPQAQGTRSMVGDPFSGFSPRTMSMSSRNAPRAMSLTGSARPHTPNGMMSPQMNGYPPMNGHMNGGPHGRRVLSTQTSQMTLNSPNENNAELMAELDQARQEITQLRAALRGSRAQSREVKELEHLKATVSQLQEENSYLKRQSRQKENPEDYDHLVRQYNILGQQLDDQKIEHDNLVQDYRDLHENYQMLQDIQEEHANLLESHQSLQKSFEELRSSQPRNSQGISDEHAALLADHEDLKQHYHELSQQHEQLQLQPQMTEEHSQLLAEHEDLKQQFDALANDHQLRNNAGASREVSADHAALVNEHETLKQHYADLKASHDAQTLSDEHAQLLAQHENLQGAHRDLQQEHSLLQTQLDDRDGIAQQLDQLVQENDHLRAQVAGINDLSERHKSLQERHNQLQAGTSVQVQSAVQELQAVNEALENEVHVLSVELAESARRELGLPTSQSDTSVASHVARLERELATERKLRLQSAGVVAVNPESEELKSRHAEATHLLDLRSQEYDELKSKVSRLEKELVEMPSSKAVQASPSSTRDPQIEQLQQLSRHAHFVEQENSRLQRMLDEVSDRGPLSDRLKAIEEQRDVLQEALRSLRERKDHEIRLLQDRVRQLDNRLASSRMPSNTSTSRGIPSNPSRSSMSSSGSQDQSFDTDENLEPPRLRLHSNTRPASPLHLNFNMDYFTDTRTRTDQGTGPLPLALGN